MATNQEYLKLLERLYSKIPDKVSKSGYQELPKLIIMNIGSSTIIRNFAEFADRIMRDPKLLMKYLLKELAVPGTLSENGQLEIQGKFSSSAINTLVDRFIKGYVQCQTCKSLDTTLKVERKVWYIQCLACGAVTTVKAL